MVTLRTEEDVADRALVSRTGRHLQRYNKLGRRLVVGSIPYRYKSREHKSYEIQELEVLVISSQKGTRMLFPKGGWEMDESIKDAASRETLEEAGVRGIVHEKRLGRWSFKSKTHDTYYEGYMFPLLVQEELQVWPEHNFRHRLWMSTAEARRVCDHWWMKEALDVLVKRLIAKPFDNNKVRMTTRNSVLSKPQKCNNNNNNNNNNNDDVQIFFCFLTNRILFLKDEVRYEVSEMVE